MSVLHLRIDNRLIHGQVTTKWVGNLGADHIVVTNDEVSEDPIQKTMLPQAARGVKTSVLSVKDTINYLESEDAEKENILIIAKFPEDALDLLKSGVEPEEVNVGNQAPIAGTDPVKITKSIAVTKEQAPIYKKISDMGFDLKSRMLPSDKAIDFIKKLNNKGLL